MPVRNLDNPFIYESKTSSRTLVFGLQWTPLVGSRVAALAKRRAVAARASHYSYGGSRGAAVGVTCLPRQAQARPCYCAAQTFARRHPEGTAAVLLALRSDLFWLGGAHDGAVLVRTDRLFDTLIAAREALAELRHILPTIHLYDDTVCETAPQPHAGEGDAGWLSQLLLAQDAECRMLPTHSAWRRIPPAWRALLAVLAIAAGAAGYAAWRRPAVRVATSQASSRDATRRSIVHAFEKAHPVQSPGAPQAVLESFRKLPLDMGGWSLTGARCLARSSRWICGARYVRSAHSATNSALLKALPIDREVEFKLLDDATVSWPVPLASAPLRSAELKGTADTAATLGTFLQRLRPAFKQVSVAAAKRLPLPVPRDAGGSIPAVPANMPAIATRQVTLSGPLRSYALLREVPGAFAWSQIDLHFRRQTAAALASSALVVDMKGVLYERQ